jgi:NAD(P)-dependent dehydrogenase (short-subunit alcohol dehydrogenase family)
VNDFQGRTAIVTGGGSGIGRALVHALAARGAVVTCADLDGAAAAETAAAAPGRVVATTVDVTDAGQVAAVVQRVAAEHDRLDLMFNNAGITFGGETQDLTLAQWNAIIDVNLRGVVHGVAAAYPLMIRQGHGQIVNTGSSGGLLAAGLITSYVATKHAVVGLSLALRTEAAAHGVGVTVLCPSAVETPILEKGHLGRFPGRDYYLTGQGIKQPLGPDVFARQALEAVARNRAMLVTPATTRWIWRLNRLAPGLVLRQATEFVNRQRL